MRIRGLVGLRFPDDLEGIDGLAQLIGALRWLGVGLDRNHQVRGNPNVKRPIAETHALVEPLGAERSEDLVGQTKSKALGVTLSRTPARSHHCDALDFDQNSGVGKVGHRDQRAGWKFSVRKHFVPDFDKSVAVSRIID